MLVSSTRSPTTLTCDPTELAHLVDSLTFFYVLDKDESVNLVVLIFIWVFPEIGVPQNGWFTMENPIKMDDLGVPLFLETPILLFFNNVGIPL